MFCENCGTQNDAGNEYCKNCGKPLAKGNGRPQNTGGYSPYTHNYSQPQSPRNNNSNTPLLIVMCVVATLLVVGIVAGAVGLIAMRDKDEDKDNKTEVEETVEVTVAPSPVAVEPAPVEEAPVAPAPAQGALEAGQELPQPQQPAQQPQQPVPQPQQPAQQPVQPAQPAPVAPSYSTGFVIADSNTRVISESELWGLDRWGLKVARNEIYARHGRMFEDDALAAYFYSQPWYVPSIPANQFNDGAYLSKTELKNAKIISDYERSQGY